MLRYLIVVAGFVWKFTSSSIVQPYIVGGETARPLEFPYLAVGTSGKLCGGSLIWPDIVLTVAHCQPAFQTDVIIGSVDIFGRDGAERILVDFLFPHENYVPGPEQNDIMLIKLQRPSSMPYVSLNFDPNLPVDDELVTVMGFGLTQEKGNISHSLQKVDLLIVNLEACRNRLGRSIVSVDSHICAGIATGGKDSCDGDSGGPVVPADNHNIIYGLTSFGAGCARPNTPAVYTRVSFYKDWIESFVCLNSASPPASCWGENTFSPSSPPTSFSSTPYPVTARPTNTPPTLNPTSNRMNDALTLPPANASALTPANTSTLSPPSASILPQENTSTLLPFASEGNTTQTSEPLTSPAEILTSVGYSYYSLAVVWLSLSSLLL